MVGRWIWWISFWGPACFRGIWRVYMTELIHVFGKVWSMQGGNVMTGSLCDPDGNCGVLDQETRRKKRRTVSTKSTLVSSSMFFLCMKSDVRKHCTMNLQRVFAYVQVAQTSKETNKENTKTCDGLVHLTALRLKQYHCVSRASASITGYNKLIFPSIWILAYMTSLSTPC